MIKTYNLKDQKDLEEFFKEVYEEMNFEWLPNGRHSDLRNIQEVYQKQNGEFWLVVDENKIVGAIALRKLTADIAELKRFFVLQKYQGKGYGQKLINVLVKKAIEEGYTFIRLDTTSKSKQAVHLFEKNGFYEISRYNDDPFAEIFMELNLKNLK